MSHIVSEPTGEAAAGDSSPQEGVGCSEGHDTSPVAKILSAPFLRLTEVCFAHIWRYVWVCCCISVRDKWLTHSVYAKAFFQCSPRSRTETKSWRRERWTAEILQAHLRWESEVEEAHHALQAEYHHIPVIFINNLENTCKEIYCRWQKQYIFKDFKLKWLTFYFLIPISPFLM